MTWDNENIISRQAVIDEIEERKNANGYRNVPVISELNRLEGYIMRLPSAERTGRWEMVSQHGNPPTYIFRCSECGDLTFGMHKFCGECGARMKSEKE